MARSITVYRSRGEIQNHNSTMPSKGASPELFDMWLAAGMANIAFEASLGSECAVRIYWSEPAVELKLPRLAAAYERGFQEGIIWALEDFDDVLAELERLVQHWLQMKLSDGMIRNLNLRAGYVREAVRIARELRGVIDIT